MDNFQKIKKQLVSLASQDESIDALWLYGSFAKGNAGPNSDIDLAVIFKSNLSDVLERRLRPELLALSWIDILGLAENSLSILDLDNSEIPLAMGVLQTGKLLVNKNSSHEFETTRIIMSKWELDYQYHYKTFG